ncbi:phospholipase-like protein [Artemisia annua]|uniref:Phospholipase-like protein n=1 Tax=Artemisia annua TaxID=35608 RepID=A0A2U1LVR2_ARTAN|nr:phospholipase-like protein [Artemisia annua]
MAFKLTNHEKQLWEAGSKLLYLQFPTTELLLILQDIETLVMRSTVRVNISNSESLKYAMHPVRYALIAKQLLSHPDVDVNISVACCICVIIRTVVGYEPYNNEQMKDFFELVVITFEKVSSPSRGCYTKMTRLLEQLRVGKFPVLMCDLQLDGLIVRLFTQFLTAADFNTIGIVLKMKKIMTVIIKESKPLNSELVKLLVRCVRRENQIPSSRRLGGDVLKNCAAELKPYLADMMVNEVYNFLGETIRSTTDMSNLRKDTTHKRKVDCLAGSSNMLNPIRRCQNANRHTDANKVNNSLGGTISTTSDRIHMLKLKSQEGIRNTVQPVTNYQHGTRDTVNLQGFHSENERTHQSNMLSFLSKQLAEAQSVVGSRIKIWSHKDEISYGVLKSYDCMLKVHKVLYDNGYEGYVHLEGQKWELVENVSVTPASLGQALPKMASTLQSDKIFVQGYKVSNSIAPILKAIFIKHGDIAAECVCKTASVRSSLLKVVCKVVRRIQTSDVTTILSEFKEIERQVLDAEATNINVSWLLAHMEAIQKRNEAMKKSTLLMEVKVNTMLVKRAAQIDLRERGTELEAAEKLFEEAERYHQGVVTFFDGRNKRHKLLYDDGDEALLHIEREQWELVQNVSDQIV